MQGSVKFVGLFGGGSHSQSKIGSLEDFGLIKPDIGICEDLMVGLKGQ